MNIGDLVSVCTVVEMPRFGWGAVGYDSVGRVAKVFPDQRVRVDFPEQANWLGLVSELSMHVGRQPDLLFSWSGLFDKFAKFWLFNPCTGLSSKRQHEADSLRLLLQH